MYVLRLWFCGDTKDDEYLYIFALVNIFLTLY